MFIKLYLDYRIVIESSQKKDVVDMSGSVIVSSSSGLAKSHGKEPMSKSVWTVLSDSQTPNTTTSVFERLVTKKVDESVAVQESTSRQDNLDSIIFSIADTSTTEEEKIKSPIPHIAESAANTKEPNITVQSTQPEESVPYPISNDECVSGNMSTEQFVSEIAEEAAP